MGSHTVLVIDDDPDIRLAVVELFQDSGFIALSAANGRHALDALEGIVDHARLPCAIVLDLMMPVMDGWTFRREQLQRRGLRAIPVVVMSAVANRATIDEGISAFVPKPFKGAELLSCIERACH